MTMFAVDYNFLMKTRFIKIFRTTTDMDFIEANLETSLKHTGAQKWRLYNQFVICNDPLIVDTF